MSRKGAPAFSSLLKDCVLWAPLSGSSVNTTGKTITANGNVTQSTAVLDPWGLSRPVGYFDGNGDYLTCGAAADWNFLHQVGTTGKWSIRFWYRFNGIYVSETFLATIYSSSQHGLVVGASVSGKLSVQMHKGSGTAVYGRSSGQLPADNNWHLITITYDQSLSANNGKAYLDGTLLHVGTKSTQVPSTTTASNTLYIGRYPNATQQYKGYIADLQIFSGVCIDGTIVPTSRAKPDAYTKLLLHMYGSGSTFVDDPFIDYDCYPIIPSGVTVTNNGTFTKTDLGNNKSVLNFDGSTNCITFSDNASFTLGTNAFSLIMWVNLSSVNAIHTLFHLFAATNSGLELYTNTSAKLCLKVSDTSTAGNMVDATGAATLVASTWYHIAVTRGGSTFTVYLNATSDSTGSSAASIIDPTTIAIGCRPTGTPDQYHYGSIKDAMLINGKALSVPEIKLLMNRTHPITGAGLIDTGKYWRLS